MSEKQMQEREKELINLGMAFSNEHFHYVDGIEFHQQETAFGQVSSGWDGAMNGTEHRLRMCHDDQNEESRRELSVHSSTSVIGLRSVINDGEAWNRNSISMSHDEARKLAKVILEEVGEE